ncbi:Phasin (PHA-granule associated protein) [Hylemonella gracilis str. Niagara R]|uniref:Phasin (PHA-granule associated protein) n=1 Tax=Hylemonella gracilis str. Niagara R TaxID=1458275 RepID=A0A016XKA8_9BURK|nr:TIGR01841 family phasin [Hylemonella gracilis]EYC51633.1 Phasin (PHA-granule associated protein) [Hylemonella gracilis str. Niagara R]
MLTAEQVLATNKANIESLFGLTSKAFEGIEKLVELHLAASKALLADSASQTQTLLSVKDPQDLLTLPSNMLQPLGEKAASYSREVYEISTATSAEFSKAFEAQFAEVQKKFQELVESTAQNAPAGSETAVALFKSAVAAANNVLETAQKSAKQAAALAETSIKAATSSAMDAAAGAADSGKSRKRA